jgi:ATP-dependent DNA helicase
MKVKGPFMVVVPLSTITNWQREFNRWAPAVDVLLYHGSKEEREAMRRQYGFETRKAKSKTGEAFPVLLTSFEVAMNDGKKLQNLDWKYLIVDEGHRLKNKDCRLLRELKALKADNRLLLSGTPLQNNLTELWSLLHFILPEIFQDLQTFQTWFDFDETLQTEDGTQKIIEDEGKNKTISKLHTILDPFLLRRQALKSRVWPHIVGLFCP